MPVDLPKASDRNAGVAGVGRTVAMDESGARRMPRWWWLPNLLTVLRLALVAPIAALLWFGHDQWALACFVVAALSDFADGAIARRLGVESRFGALADPVADKLTMLATAGMLTLQGSLPLAYLAVIALRDAIIVGGATAWHLRFGSVQMEPTVSSKFNTLIHFVLLLGTMAVRAGLLPPGSAWELLMAVAIMITIASGAQYVWVWGRRAASQQAR
ncbi:MAG: CDP-alcohol phosphatidyltransferase family protein [Burkholderiaceae bacterium]